MDPAYLLELTGGDRSVAREIMGDFLASDAEDRRRLDAALAARDAQDIHMYAHRIKGAARSIGAEEYAAIAQTIEDGASTSGADLRATFATLQQAAAALTEWAERFE